MKYPVNEPEIHSSVARFFDVVYPFTGDLEFWVDVIRESIPDKEPWELEVLELGSGTGRVTIYLARRGFRVTGLELSQGMIDVCFEKLESVTREIRERITICPGDMRDFVLPKRFDVAICPFNTFIGLLSEQERRACLRSVHSCLKMGGIIVLDIWQKNLSKLKSGWSLWNYEAGQRFYPYLDVNMSWCEYTTINLEEQLEQVEITFTEVKKDDKPKVFSGKFYGKLLAKDEIETELTDNLFRIETIYGNYDGVPWTIDSHYMIPVARKV